ncbi:hypothetical protein ES703_45521 [subsurface metagenome]
MSKRIASRRRAFSQVISAVILSAVVLSVGGVVWFFSQGVMTITSEDYAESLMNMTDVISERFIVEHVSYNGTHLHIWVFNYGDVDIEIKAQIGDVTSENWIDVALGEMMPINAIELTAITGEILDITTYTGRGNNAYYRYFVS